MSKYHVATAVIDGVEEEFYRIGEVPPYFIVNRIPEQTVNNVRMEMNNHRNSIGKKLRLREIFNSNDYSFLKIDKIEPELIKRLFEIEFNTIVKFAFKNSIYKCLYYTSDNTIDELNAAYYKVFD